MTKSSLVLVALIWGITNNFISKASKQKYISNGKNKNIATNGILNWITNPVYVISVAINLLGSLLFFYKLANSGNYNLCFDDIVAKFIRHFYFWPAGKFFNFGNYCSFWHHY